MKHSVDEISNNGLELRDGNAKREDKRNRFPHNKSRTDVITISYWLDRFGRQAKALVKSTHDSEDVSSSPLFVDESKELEPTASLQEKVHPSGFSVFKIVVPAILAADSSPQSDKCFIGLQNWELLWEQLCSDEHDEVAIQIPFLRICMEIIFHHRAVQLVYFLFVWNVTVFAVLQVLYRDALATSFAESNFINFVFEVGVYLSACSMNRGIRFITPFRFSHNNRKHGTKSEALDDTEVSKDLINQEFPISSSLRRLWYRAQHEFVALSGSFPESAEDGKKGGKAGDRSSISYYSWMNVALKVLTKDYGLNLRAVNFNRRTYRGILLFLIFLYPIYVAVSFSTSYVTYTQLSCEIPSSESCHYFRDALIGTLGGVTLLLLQYLYGASIILSLTGLAYGGEIAYRLAECWVERYSCLRRVVLPCQPASESKKNERMNEENEVSSPGMGKGSSKESYAVKSLYNDNDSDTPDVIEVLKRDASEHYLCICQLLGCAGQIWSPVLTGLLFLALYVCLADLLFIVRAEIHDTYGTIYVVRIVVFITVRFFLLVVYPVISIAYANSYLLRINDIFKISSEDDFVLIGGRDRWLQFLTSFPAVWTYYGVYITPDRLLAIFWTGLITGGGIFFSAFLSSSSL